MKRIYSFFTNEGRVYSKYSDAIQYVIDTDKQIKYTYGLTFRHPTTHNKPISKEEAIRLMKNDSMTDVDEYEDYVHINQYSSNDMW